MQKFNDEKSKDFIQRNLNDTQYMGKFLFNLLQDYLLMSESKSKVQIRCVSGSITSYLRKCWGINKLREDGDIHHCIDAAVIAMATESQKQKIINFNKFKEVCKVNKYNEIINYTTGEADKLKRQYGLALKSFIDNDNDIILNTCKDNNKNKIIKSSELIDIIEARIEEMFLIINKDLTNQGIKPRINNVILTGQGIVNISKSDVAGKINLNIPVKISTGRLIGTTRPAYRTSYALVRYIASRPFTKTVSSSIDTKSNENMIKNIFERIKEFFYS